MGVFPVITAWAMEKLSLQTVLKTVGLASLLHTSHPISTQLGPQLSRNASILHQGSENFTQMTRRWQNTFQAPHISVVTDVATAEDAQKTVQWAYENDQLWIVYNGGHGATGALGSVHDGVQIDMRRLNGIEIAGDGKMATIQAGATVYDVVRTLWAHGKQTTTGICECLKATPHKP